MPDSLLKLLVRFPFPEQAIITLLVCAIWGACSGARAATPVELVIPNFEADSPACRVRVALKDETCAGQMCAVPAARGEPVELHLTCLPVSAPTGFENPPSYVKIFAIRTASGPASLSLIDDITTPAAERQLELSFCLYGTTNNLCGSARFTKMHGKVPPIMGRIIALIKRMKRHDS